MQPPYTIARFADMAGTGEHQPPPYQEPTCARCGGPLPASGRVYCGAPLCVRRWVTVANRAERRGEDEPTLARYSWD